MVDILRIDHPNMNSGLVLPDWIVKGTLSMKIPSEADLVTQSSLQEFPIGAQFKRNGRMHRYCCAGETIAIGHQGFLKVSRTICPGGTGGGGSEAALYQDAALGDTDIYIGDTTDRAKDYYEDGFLVVMNDTTGHLDYYRIIGNDVATTLDYVKIKIAPPGLKAAHTTTSGTVGAYRSPWIDVRSKLTAANQSWFSAVGMAPFPITTGYFFWLQTAGPCWGTGASTWPGQTAHYRDVYANTDGSLIGYTAGYQKVGYLLSGTQADYGDVFFMMQLDQ